MSKRGRGTSGFADHHYRVPAVEGSLWSRLVPYTQPWLLAATTYPVSALAHGMWSDPTSLPWATAGLTLAGAGLTAVTHRAGSVRSAITRLHATFTTGITSAWFTAAAITGPTTRPILDLFLFGAPAVALSWNIRKLLRNSGAEAEGGASSLFDKVKLAGVRAGAAKVEPNKVTVPLQLPAGELDVEDVQKSADKIGAVMRLHKGAVRITPDPEDLSQATMTIVPTDVLRRPQPWEGPSASGGSIAEALVVGLYEDGEPQLLYLPGDKVTRRNATHYVVQGMNGSGKSHGAKLAWTEILTRRDAALVVLDPSKGEQTVGFLPEDSAHVIIGQDPCQDFMTRVPAAITARASQLGQWGYDQWTPEVFNRHGMPYLVIWVEEAPRVLQDAQTITRIAQEARSAGISLILSLQKASFRQMSTDIRSQLGGVWCFGVNEIEDAAFTLSEDTIDAGARPDRWKNRRPGCNYLEGPGIDDERFPVPGRTFDSVERDLGLAIAEHAPIRPGLGELTATALGISARPAARTKNRGTVVSIHKPTQSRPADPFTGVLSDDEDRTPPTLPANPEPDLGPVDLDAELPQASEIAFPGGRPTRAQARELLQQRLDELATSGKTEITVRDFPNPEQTYGRSQSWVSGELGRMATTGKLIETGSDNRATIYTFPRRNAA